MYDMERRCGTPGATEMAPKVRDIIGRLRRDGWVLVSTEGDHRQYRHPTKPGKVTVAGAMNDDLQEGTWKSVQRQAGWRARR